MRRVEAVRVVMAGFVMFFISTIAAQAFTGSSVDLAAEFSHITYKEPGIKEKGLMYGVSGAYTLHNRLERDTQGLMIKADGNLGFGQVDYDGALSDGTPYEIDNINDLKLETRISGGYDFSIFNATRLTPYFGIGYRYLMDDLSKDAAGYLRQSHYFYSPVGFETETSLNEGWSIGFCLEYDIFWMGRQYSDLSDVSSSYNDVSNDQNGGYGVRGSVRLIKKGEKADFFFEPFIRYWNIDESDKSNITLSGTIIGTVVEPKNHSTEIGLKVGARF